MKLKDCMNIPTTAAIPRPHLAFSTALIFLVLQKQQQNDVSH